MPTATADTPTVKPTDEEFAKAYQAALKYADKRAGKHNCDELSEAAINAATDGVLWARDNWHPERGGFLPFAAAAVRRFVWRGIDGHVRKHMRGIQAVALVDAEGEDIDVPDLRSHANDELGEAIESLPHDLRDAIRFFYLDGFTQRECALLMGCSLDTFQGMLRRAAEKLGKGLHEPDREPGERRLVR